MQYSTDSLQSFVAGLGTERDKMATTTYAPQYFSDAELVNAYRNSWLSRKIVSIPVFDSFRKWRNWQADNSDITKIEQLEKRLGVRGKLVEAKIKARLFGGAALFIGTGDADPSEPLNLEGLGIGGLKYLTVFPRRVLAASEINQDITSEYFGQPDRYTLSVSDRAQIVIHASRLVRFIGADLPDQELVSGSLLGWGDSILQSTLQAIKHADATAGNIASLVFEAKVDVIKIPDLMMRMTTCPPGQTGIYENELLKRLQLAATAKGINGTLILDALEDYQQKTTSFTALPDVLLTFLQLVSGAADIPVTRLLGQSPAGLSSTGEHDLRNYYDRISSIQELEIGPAIFNLDEVLIRSALGSRPPDLFYNWASLWQISDKERAEIGKLNTEILIGLSSTGLFPPDALAASGATMLVENSVLPNFQDELDQAKVAPNYELDDPEPETGPETEPETEPEEIEE